MSNENYRIENKEEVHAGGKRTQFTLYRLVDGAYVHTGRFSTQGWNRTDAQCYSSYVDQMIKEDEKSNS